MLIPEVSPIHGVTTKSALRALRDSHMRFLNGFPGKASEVLEGYQRAASQEAARLSGFFSLADLDKLILTDRHRALMAMAAGYTGAAVIQDVVGAESKDRERYIDTLIRRLQSIQDQWTLDEPVTPIAPDTNIYLHCSRFFDEIDWQALVDAETVRLMVPMRVIRELDRHKNSGRNVPVVDNGKGKGERTSQETVSQRARRAIKRLRELFSDPTAVATVRPGFEIELIANPIGYQGLSDSDSEIIRQVRAAQSLAGRAIAIVTMDGGMDFQARIDGLNVIDGNRIQNDVDAEAKDRCPDLSRRIRPREGDVHRTTEPFTE